ncbi:hypothetical protein AB0C47_03980 [Micromonospora taraxaci]|uniref:hypothetical protein n=1 Tax=Micromonospora taraxaci TaxID=1316803 RepID=UPI0033E747FC
MNPPPPIDAPPPAEFKTPSADAYAPASAAEVPEAPFGPTRKKPPLILGIVGAAVVVVAVAVGSLLWFLSQDDLTREQAQRECRSAMEQEADQRADRVGDSSTADGVLISVTGVELQEAWETDKGWSVNGTANITLNSQLLGQTPTAVNLTCEAVATDDGVRTTVKNRN